MSLLILILYPAGYSRGKPRGIKPYRLRLINDPRSLAIELRDSLVHEDIHRQQRKGYKHKRYIKAKDHDNMLSPENDPYFNQEVEIAAYAADIAERLVNNGISKETFIKNISTTSGIRKLILWHKKDNPNISTLKRYFDNKHKYPKKWHKLLKLIVHHMSKLSEQELREGLMWLEYQSQSLPRLK